MVETRSVGDTYSVRVAQTDDEHDLRRMQVERYMKNPVVLWNHDRTEKLPIARTKSLEMNDDGSWDAEFEFLPGDQFAKRIKNAWDWGFINAASVGFVTKNVGDPIELVEWGLVSVPADGGASRKNYTLLTDVRFGMLKAVPTLCVLTSTKYRVPGASLNVKSAMARLGRSGTKLDV